MQILPWRALQVAPRSEIAVATALTDGLSLVSCCYRYQQIIVNRGKRRSIMVPFIASYVFARFDHDAEMWHRVMSVNGVTRILVGVVTEEEIAELRRQVGDETGVLIYEVRKLFRRVNVGDRIRVNAGVFIDRLGTVEEVDDDLQTLRIKIVLLNREMVVNQPLAYCELDAPAVVDGERRADGSRSIRRQRRLRSRVHEKSLVAG